MNTILQKRIEEVAKEIGKKFYFVGMNPNEAAYKASIQMGNKILQNQWISVEEALPTLDEKYDFSERYIVRTQNNEIKIMRIFRNIAWCDIYRGGAYIPFEKDIVTHWMPIPSLEGNEK